MADQRIRTAVKIADPTTNANQMAVSATGAAFVEVEQLPAAVALTDAFANPTTTVLGAMLMGWNGATWDRLYVVSDGDVVAAATTGFLALGTDGANYQVFSVSAAGRLQVDVLTLVPGTGAGDLGKAVDDVAGATDTGVALLAVRDDALTALTPADGDYVRLRVDNTGRLHVTSAVAAPANPVVDTPALANLAAGASSVATALRTLDLGGTTKQLSGFEISASLPFKWVLEQVDDDVATIKVRGAFVRAGEHFLWTPPNKAYYNVTFAAGATFDGWRVVVTNEDLSETADFYVTFYYED